MDQINKIRGNFKEVVKTFRDALSLLQQGRNQIMISNMIKICGTYSRLLYKGLRRAKSVGEKKHLEANIQLVNYFCNSFKKLIHVGGSLEKKKQLIVWKDIASAFKGRIRTSVVQNLGYKEPKLFLNKAGDMTVRRLRNILKKYNVIKLNMVLCGEFKTLSAGEEIIEYKYLSTSNKVIDHGTNLNDLITNMNKEMLASLEEFQEGNSGWALKEIINLGVNVNKHSPLIGSSYIDLPPQIKRRHACVNVKNNDNACFAWSIVSALHPIHINSNRTSSYPHYSNLLNLNGIEFPVKIKDLPLFEKNNNIGINLYTLLKKKRETYEVVPVRISKKSGKRINLLMFNEYNDEFIGEEEDNEDNGFNAEIFNYHYCWIKNLSRLVSTQVSGHNGKKWICERCLHFFYTEEKLKTHSVDCEEINVGKIVLPKNDQKWISFKNYNYKQRCPFVVYADIESILHSMDMGENTATNSTVRYQKHEVHSIGYYFACSYDPEINFYRSYRGPDCSLWFAKELEQLADDVDVALKNNMPMEELSSEQVSELNSQTSCHICESEFNSTDIRVIDHCHLTGKIRGMAHQTCNLSFQNTQTIPIIFHNLSGYDAHFIIKDIAQSIDGRIDLLPINKEKYIAFTKHVKGTEVKLRFVDSFRFLPSSLEKLASYCNNFELLKKEFPDYYLLLSKKGIFPYDYIDSWSKFDETSLPPKEEFFNKLNDCHINASDYQHALNVWSTLNVMTLGEYSDIYLKTDVLLLAEIFENFRNSCLRSHRLDPAHYYTTPSLSWDAMLLSTGVKLELITDIDILLFVEKGVRGGVAQCSNRYSRANNKYMRNFNPEDDEIYLIYLDANNLYGWAMSQYLPTGNFKWIENAENFDVSCIPDDSDTGYLLEVDLEYPEAIHDLHKDLPLAPLSMIPPNSKQEKLLLTLYNKERYIIHYRNLKQYLKYGLILKKIHRILQFDQSSWLKKYIDLNTKLRALAKNEFEKIFFKLMNNAIFGKTMENVRKRVNVKLLTKWHGRYGAEAYMAKPNFHSFTIFDEDLVAVELNKLKVLMNKPIYIGQAILDISKTCLYDFHYGFMKSLYNNECKCLYTDTDSLIYEFKNINPYETIKSNAHMFDTSEYPENNNYGIPLCNKKIPGLMKDELNGNIMTEFIGLRAKMYSIRVSEEDYIKKAKGVKNCVVNKTICFDDYLNCLANYEEINRSQNLIRSFKHEVYSIKQTKIALSPYDDKRYVVEGRTDTLPWGHYSIMETEVNG